MKKILIILLISIFTFTGCQNLKNTPTSKVEEFLSNYQRLDNNVVEELDNIISQDSNMTEEQQSEYKRLLEKQYQNLSYKITNEEIKGSKATVDVEIEVYDYETAISNSEKRYLENQDKSSEDKDNNSMEEIEEEIEEISNYIDYKLEEMDKVTSKKKYMLTIELTKEKGIWKIEKLTEADLKKIHGLF
ncbi:MAG: hypothetical protein IJI22_01140 [Bacilli bacterium]|nr:hypothetical protein [Bacilli bacterium]